ncbi:MAG: YicC/YloC family endoribonuclease [Isosphaeraceae bacterium]
MLLSMTGHGESRLQDDRWTVEVELRAVNNRHLKFIARTGDAYAALEPELERIVREAVRRGTVQLNLRVERPKRAEDYRLNAVALASYRDQLESLRKGEGRPAELADLLALPGIIEDRRGSQADPHEDWAAIRPVVEQAIAAFQKSRADEGRAMAAELVQLGRSILDHLAEVKKRSPEVVNAYRDRLTDRLQTLLAERGVTIEPRDLIREVAIFADRTDIAEEIVRLDAHLAQFIGLIEGPESAGRKLEFVVQEMGREVNTIGSKAADVTISRAVVEIKGQLEKIRELIQNVE